ncbi:MAG: Pyridoxamine 5-phosphate oxidase [Acidimicrobiia bacterium]|nr:Pyridoxamine 5-phosphate oxidase [Acidimicrobiia bacterium]
MADSHPVLTAKLQTLVEAQHLFFVATAPSGSEGHVNLSPKGMDTFRVLDERTVAYLDLTGSGAETIAHLRQNGRITFMFCTFEGNPDIIRLYGQGRVVTPTDPAFTELAARFPDLPGIRSVIVADLDRVSSSCGFGVPLFEFAGERTRLIEWAQARGVDGIAEYQASRNATSIDGLPAL